MYFSALARNCALSLTGSFVQPIGITAMTAATIMMRHTLRRNMDLPLWSIIGDSAVINSACSSAEQYDLHGLKQDEKIKRERKVLNVKEIVFQLLLRFLDGGAIMARDLCPARDPRPYRVA